MSLKFIRESLEPTGWNCVDTRTSQMDSFYGLGPPDLCRVTKQEHLKERRTYFHHVVGLNTGNLSTITSYLTGLMDSSSDTIRIDAATYCAWDIFSHSDIRVTVKILSGTSNIPSVAVHCVTSEGTPTSPEEQVSPDVWEGAFISAYLRSHSVDWVVPGRTCINSLPDFRTTDEEKLLNKLVAKFISRSNATGIPRGSKRGANVFVSALCDMYIRNRRLRDSIDLFSTLQSLYPPILTYISVAHLKQRNRKAALSVLIQALSDFPEDDTMLTLMSKIISQDPDNLALAFRVIEGAVSVGPGNPWVWLQYADVCRKQRKFDRSLLALNNALDDIIPISDYDTAVVVSTKPPGDTVITVPSSLWGIGSFSELWSEPRSTCPEAFLNFPSTEPLILGPGSGLTTWFDDTLVPPPNTQPQPDKSQSVFRKVTLSRSDKTAYKILVKIREDLGWDALMDVRKSVFGQQVHNAAADLNVTGNTSMDSSFYLNETAFFEDSLVSRFGSPICCRKLDKLFYLLRDDLESMFSLKREIKEGILQSRISPEGLCRRIETCARFHKQDYLEICCRVFLGIRKCFDPYVYQELVKVYISTGKERETFSTMVGLWYNIDSKLFPTVRNFSVPSWLAPSVRTQGYRPYNHCPPWMIDLIGKVVETFGIENFRKFIQNDNRLIVLDQILAHYQVLDLR